MLIDQFIPLLKIFQWISNVNSVNSKPLSTAYKTLHDMTHPMSPVSVPTTHCFGPYTAGIPTTWYFKHARPLHLLFAWPSMPFPIVFPGELPLILQQPADIKFSFCKSFFRYCP